MTEQNDNIVNVRFKPLTSIEEYQKNIDTIEPDDILSLVFKDGEVFIISTTMTNNVGLASIHAPILNDFLFDLHYESMEVFEDE